MPEDQREEVQIPVLPQVEATFHFNPRAKEHPLPDDFDQQTHKMFVYEKVLEVTRGGVKQEFVEDVVAFDEKQTSDAPINTRARYVKLRRPKLAAEKDPHESPQFWTESIRYVLSRLKVNGSWVKEDLHHTGSRSTN